MTLSSHLDGFAEHQRVLLGLNAKSVAIYRRHVEEFLSSLTPQIGGDFVSDISQFTLAAVEEHLKQCFMRGNSNSTRKAKHTALMRFARYLIYRGIIVENPVQNLPRPRNRRKPMQAFTQSDIYAMLRQCDIGSEKGLRDAVILILGAFCGLRVGEIYGLNIEDLIDDGKRITINIPETIGKHGSSRLLDLWAAPSVYVRQYVIMRLVAGASGRDSLLVSYNRGGRAKGNRLTASAIEQLIKALADRAGIRRAKIITHMLRASHANDLQQIEGYTITAIMERMGWKDMSTAGRYLIRRERVYKKYQSLHAYWNDFTRLWAPNDKGPRRSGEGGLQDEHSNDGGGDAA